VQYTLQWLCNTPCSGGDNCLSCRRLATRPNDARLYRVPSLACTRCGAALRTTRGDHPYTESGLSHITLVNVEFRECGCGERTVVIPRVEELHCVLARTVARAPLRPLRFARFRAWEEVAP
jgi:hypothetical protein